jgi:hypothetical protein
MTKVGFFTPLINEANPTSRDRFHHACDDYFNWGDRVAYKIVGEIQKKNYTIVDLHQEKRGNDLFQSILKAISYFTLLIPLVFLIAKAVLRRKMGTLEIISSEKSLNAGITIAPSYAELLASKISELFTEKTPKDVEILQKGPTHVFALRELPDYLFKVSSDSSEIPKRYENLLKSHTIKRIHNLTRIEVPNALRLTLLSPGKKYELLIEKRLKMERDERSQKIAKNRSYILINPPSRALDDFLIKKKNCTLNSQDIEDEEFTIFDKARKLGYGFLSIN